MTSLLKAKADFSMDPETKEVIRLFKGKLPSAELR